MAAIDEGLATAFIGHPDQKRIFDEVLGLPEEVVPIGLALIGSPGDDAAPGSRMKELRGSPTTSCTGSPGDDAQAGGTITGP